MIFEEWKKIPGYPGYSASSLGRIKGPRKILTQLEFGTGGYKGVGLWVDGRKVCRRINRLVCLAWYGLPPSERHHAAHWDGTVANNVPSNLRWATPEENHADRRRHQTDPSGERNPRAKLTWPQVSEIRSRYVRGSSESGLCALARDYGMNPKTISEIVNGDIWKTPTHP